MIKQEYLNQVSLLVKVLPYIVREKCFALKGGTAINMFYQNFPRLSVDIDLTYVDFCPRTKAYQNINDALNRINKNLNSVGYKSFIRGEAEKKILCSNGKSTIKIEPNYNARGCIIPPQELSICSKVEDLFGYVDCNVLSEAETYGGKISAALNRQHPRDLFDIFQLFEQNKLDNKIMQGFVVMLLSAPRPIYELLNPNILDQENVFASEFLGMTDMEFTYKQHTETLRQLINYIQNKIKSDYKDFLLDFVSLNIDLNDIDIPNFDKLPAIKWKIHNLKKLKSLNPDKFTNEYQELKKILD